MADILSQSEIDDLLNSVASPDEETAPDEKKQKTISSNKIFVHKIYKNSRFSFPYNSPVIKKENIVFNPVSGNGNHNDKTIVRTLDNYVEHRKNKQ